MLGLDAEAEASLHAKIAWAILWQSLPIFLILNFVIPGQSTSYNGSGKISSLQCQLSFIDSTKTDLYSYPSTVGEDY